MRTISVFGNQDLDPLPVGTLVDDLLHVTRISGRDPQTGVLDDDIRVQLRNAYANMELAVENAQQRALNSSNLAIIHNCL